MEYIIIIAAIVIILGIIFLRRRGETPSDYVEPRFEHSGKQWVFNGILDIDHPPLDDTPFTDYEGDLQLMVKKGYRHLELEVEASSAKRPPLGLFKGAARIQDDDIIVCSAGDPVTALVELTKHIPGIGDVESVTVFASTDVLVTHVQGNITAIKKSCPDAEISAAYGGQGIYDLVVLYQ